MSTTGETTEGIELGERNKGGDGADSAGETGTDETSFGGDDRRGNDLLNTSIPVSAGFNPDIVGESSRPGAGSAPVPDPVQTIRKYRLATTSDQKKHLV